MSDPSTRSDWAPEIRARLSSLRLSPAREAEIVEELAQHLDERYRELLAGGVTADEAARMTRAELQRADLLVPRLAPLRQARANESPGARQYQGTGTGSDRPMRLMPIEDVRHAWRRLTARPAPALLCIALLALGTGLSTAMFSVVDSLILRPAPFRDADRLVMQTSAPMNQDVKQAWVTSGLFESVEIVSRSPGFQFTLANGSIRRGAWVTPALLDMLGVRPVRGRLFDPPGPGTTEDEFLLSETIWRSDFGADPNILGQRIRIEETPVVVVGIMPASFRFPAPNTLGWRRLNPAVFKSRAWTLVGRLKPGVPAAAATHLADVGRKILQPLDGLSGPVRPLSDLDVGQFVRQGLWLLLAGVTLVFVVLCANVSSILVANLAARRREFAMCAALGASRARLMRQTMVEHALIAAAGTAGGIGLAWGLASMIPAIFLDRTLNPIDIDFRAQLAASSFGAVSVLLAGVIPAWLGTRTAPLESLRESRSVAGDTRTTRAATRGLLIAQIALACSLLAGSALLVRSFVNLMHTDRGLNTDGIVRVGIGFLSIPRTDGVAYKLAIAAVEAQATTWPDITAFALTQELPPSGMDGGRVHLGHDGSGTSAITADGYRVTGSFFGLYGIPILRGRTFAIGDAAGDVLVSQRLAEALWPGLDPLGRTFAVGRRPGTYRVIGVAGELRLPTLNLAIDRPEFYRPLEPDEFGVFMSLRCRAACPNEATLRARIDGIQPGAFVRNVSTSEDEYVNQLRLPRAMAQIAGVFAVVAVITAAGGLFSVLSSVVARRRREFGIRSALGASPGQMRRLVFHAGFPVVAAGVAAGLFGGWVVGRSLAAFQYGVTAVDPVTWAAVFGTIAVTSIAAAWRPARQAMRVDPVKLLREE